MRYIARRHLDEAQRDAARLTNLPDARQGGPAASDDEAVDPPVSGSCFCPSLVFIHQGYEPEEDVLAKTRKLTPEARRLMLADIARVHEHGERREYAEAKKLALKVAGGLAVAGVASAHLSWLLAITCDYQGEVEEAFRYITEAMRMDPLEPNIEKSFGIITDRIRRTLIDPDRDLADRSTPRLHGMLVEAGKADELVHLALARHLAEVGKDAEAMKLIEAVLLLSPACRDAWVVKAMLAKKLGLVEDALAAEAEAAALDGGPVPLFGIPGQAVA
jgi:tetratricopeptide (TPR) repeat protein